MSQLLVAKNVFLQILIIDGDELKQDPAAVMSSVQLFLKVEPIVDYKDQLRYEPRKGFFCQVTAVNTTKCLGKSKGRSYEEMDEKSEKFLRTYYMSHNVALSKLLTKLHVTPPHWLEEELIT